MEEEEEERRRRRRRGGGDFMASLALRCRREVCMCVCVCVCVCLMCQLRRVLVSSFVHDTHRRRSLLCMLCSVWPHRSVLFVCGN